MSSVPVDAVMDLAPYLVRAYMDGADGRVYFDPHRFRSMRYHDDDHFISDVQMHEDQLTGVGGWVRRWRHWGRKRAISSSAVGTRVDSPFVWCVEERDYEKPLSVLMDDYSAGEGDVSKLALRLVCFDRPFRTPFWISNFNSWAKNIHFEIRMRTSERLPIFTGWQNVVIYAISLRQRCNAYVHVPPWWANWESCRILCIPTQAIISYYTNFVFSGGYYHDQVWDVVK